MKQSLNIHSHRNQPHNRARQHECQRIGCVECLLCGTARGPTRRRSTLRPVHQAHTGGHSEVMQGSFVSHLGVIQGSFGSHPWGRLGVIWVSSRGHLGVIQGSFGGHPGVICGSSRGHFECVLKAKSAQSHLYLAALHIYTNIRRCPSDTTHDVVSPIPKPIPNTPCEVVLCM